MACPAGAALLILALLARMAACDIEDAVSSVMTTEDVDVDEESDSAAFMIIVEHEDEWRCTGSLLSQRTAVTTARCALGPERLVDGGGKQRDIWALASALLAAQAPVSLAAAARRVRRIALATAAPRALNLALLELERPFSFEADARPILLATSLGECERASQCNAVRALAARQERHVRLRVIDLKPTENARCATRVPHWPTSPRRLVCYAGDELCENDLGGGVVCDGKLCAVLGDTAAPSVTRKMTNTAGRPCSQIYAALAVEHWRRFLHCAHTLRLCGRGDCAKLCSELRLIPADGVSNTTDTHVIRTAGTSWKKPEVFVTRSSLKLATISLPVATPTRTRAPPPTSTKPTEPTEAATIESPAGRSGVFEPNRADFKVNPSRTTLVRLKAGEYGDNVAEYEDEDLPPPPTRTSAAADPTTPAPTPARFVPVPLLPTGDNEPPALERRLSPSVRAAAASISTPPLLVPSMLLLKL